MKQLYRLCCVVLLLLLSPTAASAQAHTTENVILVTADGLRWQEVFGGADETLLNKESGGVENVEKTRATFWSADPAERRARLMPFFWSTIAKQGQVYGNAEKGSLARITNTMKFSYPGYNEILTGFADPKIDSNANVPNANVTVLEWLHRRPGFEDRVAAFSGWDAMAGIINRDRCGFPVLAGWERLPEEDPNERQQLLSDLLVESTPVPADEVGDALIFHAALEHMKRHQPRVLYFSFLETDHWAHSGRYDLVLRSARLYDEYVRRLWEQAQSMPQYKDKTTIVLVPDHGRGSGLTTWKDHGRDIDGSERIWMAFLGPDTPALGERENVGEVTQSQVAATIAALLGEDYHGAVEKSGAPIADVLGRK